MWCQLFKALLAYRSTYVKTSTYKVYVDYIIKYAIIFCWKIVRESFAVQKDVTFFQQKTVFAIFTFKILTKR